jgi:hypothetical protein
VDEPRALIAVSATTNRAKADQDPREWLPPFAPGRCRYVVDWVTVKTRWTLSVDQAGKTVSGQSEFPVDGHPRTASSIPRWRPVARSVIAAGSSAGAAVLAMPRGRSRLDRQHGALNVAARWHEDPSVAKVVGPPCRQR